MSTKQQGLPYFSHTRMPGFIPSFWKPNDAWLIDLGLIWACIENENENGMVDAAEKGLFKAAPLR